MSQIRQLSFSKKKSYFLKLRLGIILDLALIHNLLPSFIKIFFFGTLPNAIAMLHHSRLTTCHQARGFFSHSWDEGSYSLLYFLAHIVECSLSFKRYTKIFYLPVEISSSKPHCSPDTTPSAPRCVLMGDRLARTLDAIGARSAIVGHRENCYEILEEYRDLGVKPFRRWLNKKLFGDHS